METTGASSPQKPFRLFILGAGFSKPAGLPLASQLWNEIRIRASHLGGRANQLQRDVDNYREFMRLCCGEDISESEVDFEDLMRVLDIEHFLGLRGSDTWSEDGNESTVIVKTLIGEILAQRTPEPGDVPEVYLEFARRLCPGDYILTFNYDVLLERAMDHAGTPYRLFPSRFSSVGDRGAMVDQNRDLEEVVVLKLHGSIDWFDRKSYSELVKQAQQHDPTYQPPHPVFGRNAGISLARLLEGPRFDDDPLQHMFRVRDIRRLYQTNILFHATPWLLSPSALKILYAHKLRDFWYGLGQAGLLNFGLAVIGYSLPPQDEYARQLLYTVIRNYQENWWNGKGVWMKKTPFALVDFCQTPSAVDQLKGRYRFVNWDRAILWEDGFNQEALDVIFRQTEWK